MVISLFGHTLGPQHKDDFENLLKQLNAHGVEILVFESFYQHITKTMGVKPKVKGLFSTPEQVTGACSLMLSIGGDGSFLSSTSYVRDSGIPIAGINFGRLGFLANITSTNLEHEIECLCEGRYTVEQRSLLQVSLPSTNSDDFPYALNELSIHKDGAAMVTIEAYLNSEHLCTYWADGLIVATPTGSTAYSMSVGGPIVSPLSNTFTISAIAPHNLSLRPLVIPDSTKLTLIATSREERILVTIDSRTFSLPNRVTINASIAPFHIGVVNLEGTTYYKTLRNKLMWGVDKRNNF